MHGLWILGSALRAFRAAPGPRMTGGGALVEPVETRNAGRARRDEVGVCWSSPSRPGVGIALVARGGVEPPTFRFSVGRSYQLSYLALTNRATPTGLEPATSAVTGRRANQLRYGASCCARQRRDLTTWFPLTRIRTPNGIRTRATAVKGRGPRPLDDGDPYSMGLTAEQPRQAVCSRQFGSVEDLMKHRRHRTQPPK